MPPAEESRRGPQELTPSTLTHARLREAQGDVSGARAILRAILRREPGHAAAAAALRSLAGRPSRRARIARLREWQGKIERGRRDRPREG